MVLGRDYYQRYVMNDKTHHLTVSALSVHVYQLPPSLSLPALCPLSLVLSLGALGDCVHSGYKQLPSFLLGDPEEHPDASDLRRLG